MKKTIAWLLLAMLLLGSFAVAEEAAQLDNLITVRSAALVDDPIGVQEGTELVVGSVTELAGYFATDLWGNNTADLDVRKLLHGYSTIAWLRSSEMMIDGMAVATMEVSGGADGSRTYTINLMTDLVYNDGTPITAKDYVFSLLLCAAPEIAELGGQPRGLAHFAGYEAYLSGSASGISGIRLLSDHAFSLEISAEYLPYFYGLAMLDVTPYPMHVIAPGCDILDDGTGAYIGRGADADSIDAAGLGYTPGDFSAQMLQNTLLDPETGYVFNPQVTSGPYVLEAFDKETKTATFTVNERYLGNYEGQKPHIERLVFRSIKNEEMYDALLGGEVDLINKVLDGGTIQQILQLTAAADSVYGMQSYAREGLSFLAFACETGVTADVAVRQAIARCVNKAELVEAVSPYALGVNAYYGLGQWITTYTADADAGAGQEALSIPEVIETFATAYDVEAAKAILAEAGWACDAAGNAYTTGTRYRKEADGSLTPLIVKWAKSNDSATSDTIEAHIAGPLAAAGIDLQITEMSFEQLLRHYYRLEARTYDMFFLASNFLSVFDPYYDYHTAEAYQGAVNTSGLRDERLMALALAMRSTPAMDTYGYAQAWIDFQTYWLEVMPLVPLYTNVYFDFFTGDLQAYDVTRSNSWAVAIPYAWLGEAPEVESGGDTLDGFTVIDSNN